MQEKSAITRTIETAAGVHAPGHLGELTQIVDFALVDAVLEETGAREKRLRLLPSRVVVYFVLALALFEQCSYRVVWGKLTAALDVLAPVRPAASSLARARRRVGAVPLRRLFEVLAGPVADRGQAGSFYRGLRTVALDGTHLHVPDDEQVTWRYPKRVGELLEFGYPLLRLLVVVECGTRAVLAACFGPEDEGELPYARHLLSCLDASMLLLGDAAFDAVEFLREVTATGAQFLVRSSARRRPTIQRRLPDGSYLARLAAPYRAGSGYSTLPVRMIEAWITVTLADGTTRREPWRLVTSLLDHERYPASELVELYHRRWQVETTYFSIKATMLDGRVLRSRSVPGLDQEVYALLATYQALIRTAADAVTARPGLAMERISFTVLLQAAADQVTTATGIHAAGPNPLLGPIGRMVLDNLLPTARRQRVKARSRKNPTSKYGPNAGKHPQTAQTYTLSVEIHAMEGGLSPRARR
ncbi:IS4 family transposase [Streptomyces sp. LS1784]|uniref:IS4 family transposase n=1 Tax=Streptomyces sp. LS1784 TaxID=2851533 RepID=UPI001CCDD185|nr:IS4 family transposase [Streptomyces sp. LS1784]